MEPTEDRPGNPDGADKLDRRLLAAMGPAGYRPDDQTVTVTRSVNGVVPQ